MSRGGRPLTPDERALWARVKATVQPLHRALTRTLPPALPQEPPVPAPKPPKGRVPSPRIPPKPTRTPPESTLDGGWDRRISRGMVQPDSTLDLHGHTLSTAYSVLDQGLARSLQRGDRVLLLITGKPPRPESERPHARGAIRAAVPDWLATSAYSDRIATVRTAHPRHGGQGALYIVFRRERGKS